MKFKIVESFDKYYYNGDYIKESGYSDYSMSNNAVIAYEQGEKPLSKWTKQDIINSVKDIDSSKVSLLSNVPLNVLKDKLLRNSSWHHTSSHYNRTNFYEVDELVVDSLTKEEVEEWLSQNTNNRITKSNDTYKGFVHYIEWGGTRNHPKANHKELDNVNIEERGSFYIVTDNNGNELLRKKIGSNGTYVINYDKEKQKEKEEKQKVKNSSSEAQKFYKKLMKDGYEKSLSGHYYLKGRKPSSVNYDNGIENFLKVGEKRLVDSHGTLEKYTLEIWDGNDWVKE